ncbi:MAG: NADH:ubiquinone oxidoreductase subunit J [Legionellales bacterium RIFCSPHIGHO2_12_FULL_42_9]|nr:MAG: NADH:ubiquinone oxidoreductase subunit J [Legionellales bacterium RIFCSPHIGHO2_12_FULL_42_9]
MKIGLTELIFYVFAAVVVISAAMVVTQKNPVRCVLFLVLAFFASAVLWMLQEAEFLALILVLVYVGAVMTLFLFIVMMLNIDVAETKLYFTRYLPFGLIIVALLVGLLMISLPEHNVPRITESLRTNQIALTNTEAIGMVLYTDYVFAFELAAVLLLVAIVAAVSLTHRVVVRSKKQQIDKQLMTRACDRIELLSMKSEK